MKFVSECCQTTAVDLSPGRILPSLVTKRRAAAHKINLVEQSVSSGQILQLVGKGAALFAVSSSSSSQFYHLPPSLKWEQSFLFPRFIGFLQPAGRSHRLSPSLPGNIRRIDQRRIKSVLSEPAAVCLLALSLRRTSLALLPSPGTTALASSSANLPPTVTCHNSLHPLSPPLISSRFKCVTDPPSSS